MALTSRRKRPLDRQIPHLRDASLCIIATEGSKTEKRYFEGIFRSTRIQVKVIATGKDGRSSPDDVLARLDGFKEEFEIDDEDSLWLMIDVDRWGGEKLSKIARYAVQKGYGLAISNPCFESWLYLHLSDLPDKKVGCRELQELIKGHIGSYNKSNLVVDHFVPFIDNAILRAKALHEEYSSERWPSKPGSHVYKVTELLQAK